ncbi:MAG: phosphoribosylanthranilate isomerase [Epulopiscium sp.]|uniref:phosphoribosylanthranilate isomerase n=1 Tax=Defluviitalea raffinosedens TaxID=1450156 RepID=UPI001A9C5B35|nr:phosphoribosylanthranilate isomerase [Defluviitalea raffinosedens]MBM7684614.1 phosphoribosylanthranilate isomerase [Defluviitalea raffinosedens]MDK2787645.1 phosphoribosylanthranilate isomerase [Candidatus Epulonipiscium sp.]
MIPKIKICGLKTVEQIKMINRYDVDYVGFIFAKSKRQISPNKAREMKLYLRKDIKAVGVFVDTPIEEVNEIVQFCNLDMVQFHGKEDNDQCAKSIVPVWKAFSVKDGEILKALPSYQNVQGFVFDSSSGGSGKTFSWDLIKGISKDYFTVLAGGLNAENVREAIKTVFPHVVDVSSGVETNGEKDEEKIKEFIRKVKSYEIG